MSNPYAPPGEEPDVPQTPQKDSTAASDQGPGGAPSPYGAYGARAPQSGSQGPQPPDSATQSPWPVYGQDTSASQLLGQGQAPAPHYGQAQYGQGQGGQPQYGQQSPYGQQGPYGQQHPYGQQSPTGTPYLHSTVPSGPPPSRTGAIWTLVLGLVAMLIGAPAVFFGFVLGTVGASSLTDGSLYVSNGGTVIVDESGVVGVTAISGEVEQCSLVPADAPEIVMVNEEGAGIWVARDLTPGEYILQCDGVPTGSNMLTLSGDTLGGLVSTSVAALGWASLVGILGLIATVVGIVWLVSRNRRRRAYFEALQ